MKLHERIRTINYLKALRKGRNDIKFFAEFFLGIKTNLFQARIYDSIKDGIISDETIELLVKAGNRSGKTVALSIIHIWAAFYKMGLPGGEGFETFEYRTLDLSPKSRQAKQCLLYIEQILDGRMSWMEGSTRKSNANTLRLTNFFVSRNEQMGEIRYKNGSKTYAVGTGSDQAQSIQGLSFGIITYDECVLSHHLRDELVGNIYSRLGDYGFLLMLVSTPNDKGKSQQYFYHLIRACKAGENSYRLVQGSYDDNTFIEETQRIKHRKRIEENDPELAAQVLEGAFVSTGGRMLEVEVIDRLFQWDEDKTRKKIVPPQDGHDYLISVDWGIADQGDPTVILVFDYTMMPWRVVNFYFKRGGDPWELMATLERVRIEYNCAKVIMDTASLGGALLKKMLKRLKPMSFNAHSNGGRMKRDAQTYMQLAMTKGRNAMKDKKGETVENNPNYGVIRSIYLPLLEEQLSIYQADDERLEQDWVATFYQGVYWLYKRFFAKKEKKSFRITRGRRRGTSKDAL